MPVSSALDVVRRRRGLLVLVLALTPAVALVGALLTPPRYRSEAELWFKGANTGTPAGDIRQARRAATDDTTIAARALDVAGITDVDPAQLRAELDFEEGTAAADVLGVAVVHGDDEHVQRLTHELTRILGSDQLAPGRTPATAPERVAPRPAQSALLGLAAAIPLAVLLALLGDLAARRRTGRAPAP